MTLLKKLVPLLFLLVILPASAIPVYSYDEGIEKLKTAPLAEIDKLAEEFAMGEFDVSKGMHREDFYKLLSNKVSQIPRIQKARDIVGKAAPNLKNTIDADFTMVEQLTYLYALASLFGDPPDVFKAKYQRFIDSALVVRQTELPEGLVGIGGIASFQTVAVIVGRESQTSESFIKVLYKYHTNTRVTNSENWNMAMVALLLTNLRAVDRVAPEIQKYQEVMLKDYLIKNINALAKDPLKQYEYALTYVNPIVKGGYSFSFKGLDNWFEIILNNKNSSSVVAQVQFLMDFYRQRSNWELTITPDLFLKRTLALVDKCPTVECANSKSVVLASMMARKRVGGRYEEATTLSRESAALNNIVPEASKSSTPLLVLVNDFETQLIQGKYAEAEVTVKRLREYIADIENFPYATPEMYHSLAIVYGLPGIRLDLKMGRFADAKKTIESDLQKIDIYKDKNIQLKYSYLDLKTQLMGLLGEAEIGLGNVNRGNELISYVRNFNAGSSNFSFIDLETNYWNAFLAKDFEGAYEVSLKLQSLYQESINSGISIKLDALTALFKNEERLAKNHIGKTEVDQTALTKFWENNGSNIEVMYFTDPYASPEERLKSLRINWVNYSFISKRPVYSAFYAKRYVNLLQELRTNIKSGYVGSLGSFTAVYKDTLQQMSQTFYAANDFDSASKVLNIIKENELLDFSTEDLRAGIIETYLSYTKDEQEFFKKVRPIERHLNSIYDEAIKARDSGNISRFKRLSVDINTDLVQIQKYLIRLKNLDFAEVKLAKSEKMVPGRGSALVQTIVSPDEIVFRISTDTSNEQVIIPIARDKLRLMIYQAYNAFSTPGQDWRPGLEALDRQVFSLLNSKLKSLGVGGIFFVGDDALTFLPPDFIFNSQANNFNVISIVSAKAALIKNGQARIGVDAFAATKGGGNFPPLPSAGEEANFLASYKFLKLKQDGAQRAFVDSKFTRAALRDSLSNSRDIVHIASHFKASGGTDKDVGLLLGDGSFLSLQDLFAGGQSFSGISLLTLSACETGVSLTNLSSQAKTFDGLAGLFAKRGVSQVMATLWKISDSSTADFMKVFYIYKESEGLTASAALERAKALFSGKNSQEIQILSNKYADIFTPAFNARIAKYSHPFYWAGFVLVSSGT